MTRASSNLASSALIFVIFLLPFCEADLVAGKAHLCYHVSMPDSTKEIVEPAAEAIMPFVPSEVSPHVKTEGDIEHLGRIHSELAGHGVETTGELTQVPTEPQALDPSQFEVKKPTQAQIVTTAGKGGHDDTSSWGSIFARRKTERGRLKRAA